MLFNEKEMLELCEKHGIEIVEKEGYPLLDGAEMSSDFSISELLNESYSTVIEERTLYTNSMNMCIDCSWDVIKNVNNSNIESCNIIKDNKYSLIVSTINFNNENRSAA